MPRRLTSPGRAGGLLAVAVVAAAVGFGARASGALDWLERGSVDARFALRGERSPPAGVVVVGIDNETLAHLPRYPFSRVYDARVLERLHAAGARLVVFDLSFDRPTTPRADLALFTAARRSPPVVFATSLISASGGTEVLGGNANLASIGAQAAAADLAPDGDGVIRHALADVNGLPTIAAAVADRLAGQAQRTASATQLHGGWIDFRGPPGTVRSVSFLRVLRGRFAASAVRGKVVVVGATAPVLQDVHDASVGGPMSGPEVQAQAIATALGGFPLRSPPGVVTALLIVCLAALLPAACLVSIAGRRLDALGVGLTGTALACTWSLAAQLAFLQGSVLDFSAPLAALLTATGGTLVLTMWGERRERRRLRALFAAAAPAVVEEVLHGSGAGGLRATAVIAGYRLEEVVGRGGMGVVYRATQVALNRKVAIKLIAGERGADPEYRERFKLESRAAASIDHANVVPVFEAGEDDGLLFIAMRLVDGVDLARLLDRVEVLEPARAVTIVDQIAGALDAAHAKGLVHRDVKPANVLLTVEEPEHVYLTDFGVVATSGARRRITRKNEWVGSIDYLAPEQIRGEAVGAAGDVYALTGLLYRCLTGATPFAGESEATTMWAHLSAPPPRPSELASIEGLPVALDEVIARGMAKDPGERYASAGELAQAAAHALGVPSRLSATETTAGHVDERSRLEPGRRAQSATAASTVVSNRRRAASAPPDEDFQPA